MSKTSSIKMIGDWSCNALSADTGALPGPEVKSPKRGSTRLWNLVARTIQILARNIILRHFMRSNFPLVSVPGVFHALHHVGLERVSFFEQLVHTLRIRSLDVGQSLQISRLLPRPHSNSAQCESHRAT